MHFIKDCDILVLLNVMHIIILYGIYLKGSGIGVPGHFQIMVEKYVCIVYNMLNKEADTIADTYPFPAQ